MAHHGVSLGAIALAAGIAGAAQASAPFQVRSVDAASLGSPIAVSGTLFQSTAAGAGDTGPSPLAIENSSSAQWAEYDSYVAIDTGPSHPGVIGNKSDGFHANPGDLSLIGNPFANPATVAANWFMTPAGPRPSAFSSAANAGFPGLHGLFLGRFSFRTTDGSTPTGSLGIGANGVVIDMSIGPSIETGGPAFALVRFSAFGAPVTQGFDGGNLSPVPLSQPYELRQRTTFAQRGSAQWLISDLYVVAVPSPGAAGLSLVGLLTATRRVRTRRESAS